MSGNGTFEATRRLLQLGREPDKGHSKGFQDAVWVSEQVGKFYGKWGLVRGSYRRPGVKGLIHFSPWPFWPVITFESAQGKSPLEGFPRNFQRVLCIKRRGKQDRWLEHPKWWRGAERKVGQDVQTPAERPLEFFERNARLYFEDGLDHDELALQIFLVLWRWHLVPQPSEADRNAFIKFVMKACKRTDQEFRLAAAESVSYLFTNWVMPQSASDFRSYAKRVAFDRYCRSRSGQSQPTEQLEDYLAFNRRSRPSRDRCASEFTTARGLAQRIGIHQQRINEAIRKGLLPAIKRRGVYLIAESDAEEYLERTEINRRARNVGKALRSEGKRKEAAAFRKRIYRMKRSDAPRIDLLRVIGDAEAALSKSGAVQAKTAN